MVVKQDGRPGQETSVAAEVDEVVALVLEHARTRPGESLGVIALGIKHAERIDLALREALALNPRWRRSSRTTWPNRSSSRTWNACRDERDAIILSIGYGKHPDGRLRYQWGPLLRDGGERRLNVAATRAKHRLTVVSAFSSHDVDPDRLTKAGARLLAEYSEYAGSGGTPDGRRGGAAAADLPASVRSRLAEYGITVVPQYGVGGYRARLRRRASRRPVPDDPGRGGRRGVLSRLRQRPRPGPAAQGALGAVIGASIGSGPPTGPRPRHRSGQAPRSL